ncbi:MAG: aldehyde ferredoxin oxidoreductase C-terminal domain-containing protein, partial [Thermoplasmatota archaeon]
FSSFALDEKFFSRFMRAVTGEEIKITDLHRVGERIYNLERQFNIEAGFDRKDDCLPDRFSEPLENGASSGNTFDLDKMLDEYYNVMGWDEDGKPKKETLDRLEI